MKTKYFLVVGIVVSAVMLTACQSVPHALSGEYSPISVSDARNKPDSQAVRWGGVIAKVENKDQKTVIEIVAKPLNSSARPRDVDATNGRFLAVIPDFIDPVVYKQGREVTVTGNLTEIIEGKIGEMDYLFPVVNVNGHYLWRERKESNWDHHHYHPSYWPSPYWVHNPYRYRIPKKVTVRRPIEKSKK